MKCYIFCPSKKKKKKISSFQKVGVKEFILVFYHTE